MEKDSCCLGSSVSPSSGEYLRVYSEVSGDRSSSQGTRHTRDAGEPLTTETEAYRVGGFRTF